MDKVPKAQTNQQGPKNHETTSTASRIFWRSANGNLQPRRSRSMHKWCFDLGVPKQESCPIPGTSAVLRLQSDRYIICTTVALRWDAPGSPVPKKKARRAHPDELGGFGGEKKKVRNDSFLVHASQCLSPLVNLVFASCLTNRPENYFACSRPPKHCQCSLLALGVVTRHMCPTAEAWSRYARDSHL